MLLRFAAAGFYDLLWSERILDEMERNLVADGRVDEDGARRLRIAMTTAFDDAIVPDEAISAIEDAMTNDPKDRHVLAAAVASEAQAVVTINLADFPAASTDQFGIDALHPDDFLMVQFGLDPDRAVALVGAQAADLRNPPYTVEDVLERLDLTVPTFAAAIREIRA
jgi:predicted nucleic acid-binding protein